jgi:methionyl-tRNA formyltransferase
MTLRVAFFGSSQNVFSGRFYEALTRTPCEIVAAVDVPVAKRASTNSVTQKHFMNFAENAVRNGVPVYEPADPNTPAFVSTMRSLAPDLFLAVGYMFRLRSAILATVRIVSANVHASLLPAYRGRSPVFWALRHGEHYSGLTIHAMDDRLDTGDLLYQVRVRTRKDDSVTSLYDRIIASGVKLVPRLVADATHTRLPRRSQPNGTGSYFSAANETDFRIDWTRNAEELRRWIVITPGQCFSIINQMKVCFLDAAIATNAQGAEPGTVLKIDRLGCTIATGSGALQFVHIELPTARQMPMAQFCQESGISIGDQIAATTTGGEV